MSNGTTMTSRWIPEVPRAAWIAATVMTAAFFLAEHDVFLSQADHFTETAEEMLAQTEGGNLFRRIAFLTVAAVGGVCLLASSGAALRPSALSVVLLGLMGLSFASVLWTDDVGLCVRRLFVLALAFMGAAGLARRFTFSQLCVIAMTVAMSCSLLGLLCEIGLGSFRPWTADYRFSGTVHPNTQGAYLAVSCSAALCLWSVDPQRRRLYGSVLIVALLLLFLTKSRTSAAGVLFSLGLTVLVMSSLKTRVLIPLAAAGWLAAAAIGLLLSGSAGERIVAKVALLGREEEAESFSGRTTIWPAVQYYIDKRYWLGYGYESFWTPDHIEEITRECQWPVREAHSSYLDMMLALGAVGLMFYVLLAVGGILTCLADYARRRDAAVLCWFALLLNALINAGFESGMMMISFPTFVLAMGLVRLSFFSTARAPSTSVELWQPAMKTFSLQGVH